MVESIIPILYTLLLLALFSIPATSVGFRILNRLHLSNRYEPAIKISVAFGIGSGLFSLTLFVIGCLWRVGVFPSLILLFAFFLIAGKNGLSAFFADIKQLIFQFSSKDIQTSVRILIFLLGLMISVYMLLSLAPPTIADALKCHLNYCKYYIYKGSITHYPSARHSGIPFLAQTLYLWGLSLGSARFAGVLCWFTGVMLCIGIYGYGKQFGGVKGGVFSAIIFYFMPVTMLISISPMVDLYVGFYASLTLLLLISDIHFKSNSAFLPAMMTAGFAGASKTNGLFLVFPLILLFLFKLKKKIIPSIKKLIVGICLYCICVSPMYIRTWIWTGNPFYPVAFPMANKLSVLQRFNGISASIGTQNFKDRSVGKIFLIPYQLVFNPEALSKSRWKEGSGITPTTLGMLPLAIFGGKSVALLPFISSFLFQILVYFSGGLSSRFFWPCEPAVTAGVGAGIGKLLQRDKKRILQWPIFILLFLGIFQTSYITFLYSRNMMPVIFGSETRDQYLSRTTPFYETWQWLNNSIPPDAVICSGYSATFYLRQPHVFLGDLAGVFPYLSEKSSKILYSALKKNHVDYVILGQEHLKKGTATRKLIDDGYLIQYKQFPNAQLGSRSPIRRKPQNYELFLFQVN